MVASRPGRFVAVLSRREPSRFSLEKCPKKGAGAGSGGSGGCGGDKRGGIARTMFRRRGILILKGVTESFKVKDVTWITQR